MGKAIEIVSDVMSSRLDKQKSVKTQESSHVGEHCGKSPELYSSAECIQIVESIRVDDDTYMNFQDKIHDKEQRKIFLAMSDDRRKVWLNRLK